MAISSLYFMYLTRKILSSSPLRTVYRVSKKDYRLGQVDTTIEMSLSRFDVAMHIASFVSVSLQVNYDNDS